jgi:hypothetical protein
MFTEEVGASLPATLVLTPEQFCPPTMQLANYAGQFVTSKRRILKRAYEKYEYLDGILTADAQHWIHGQPK